MKKLVSLSALLLAGCVTSVAEPLSSHDAFFSRLSDLCGKAFEGRVVSPPVAADASFAGKPLLMHVRECSSNSVRIPFHVGDDRSRTWVVTRTPDGVRLKHDHRHSDGSEDVLTQYGGDTIADGNERRQEFPADQFSKDLFSRNNAAVSTTNVWAMEIELGRTFTYELRRPGRFFRVDFDLTRPVTPPPPPWGS